jgi:dTDP-4-amino-4,6-dideoxygalactose transaminase
MPPITIKGILDVVLDLELKPVFVDIDPDTLCFDCDKLKRSITSKTKAILITYLFGIVPDLDRMIDICKKSNIFIIEDFSQCLNGKHNNRRVGTFGDAGIYSASSIKTLDTYGGGLLVCDDDDLYNKLNLFQSEFQSPSRLILLNKIITDLIRNIATRLVFHFIVFPLIKLSSRVNPGSVMKHTGGRSQEMIKSLPKHWFERYTSFQANLGFKNLSLIQASDETRVNNVAILKANMPLVKFPKGVVNTTNVYWQLVAYFKDPLTTQRSMHRSGVDTSTTSLENISSLSGYPYKGDTPNADYLYKKGLFIPAFPGLSSKDLQYISSVVNIAIKKEL